MLALRDLRAPSQTSPDHIRPQCLLVLPRVFPVWMGEKGLWSLRSCPSQIINFKAKTQTGLKVTTRTRSCVLVTILLKSLIYVGKLWVELISVWIPLDVTDTGSISRINPECKTVVLSAWAKTSWEIHRDISFLSLSWHFHPEQHRNEWSGMWFQTQLISVKTPNELWAQQQEQNSDLRGSESDLLVHLLEMKYKVKRQTYRQTDNQRDR